MKKPREIRPTISPTPSGTPTPIPILAPFERPPPPLLLLSLLLLVPFPELPVAVAVDEERVVDAELDAGEELAVCEDDELRVRELEPRPL